MYLTLNAFLHEYDKNNLKAYLKEIQNLNIDAFIISDLGVLGIVKETIPEATIHISTQASVTNSYSCKMYESLGASRIILARELSLDEIKEIRDNTDLELESFVHGAVCMSYSGRCLLSNFLNNRDANGGECSQVCRWNFKTYIEEKTRPGEFMEIEEGENHSTILSSRDLQMAEYLHLLQKAGIDSIKIEGRMKSVYYVANTVRVYRILLDLLDRIGYDSYPEAIKKEPIASYLKELETISRRESDTGFYFGRDNIKPTLKGYLKGRRLMGMISDDSEEYAKITVYNTIKNGDDLIYIGKDFINHNDNRFKLFIKTEENEFVEVDNIRNIDNAYIKSGVHDFKKYDIITVEEN
ncbi:peptidase [Brachyspira hyodysenteriae WA1]|uniref:Peptidase n=2 Tax=Brachyspira hyodysenteriae TaxID=159 RepID=A0A3B6VAJ8_BRAHW|nr:peptidase [Brachyspira hyodysenteriae WA1]